MCGFFAANFQVGPEQLGKIAARLQTRGPDDIVARGFDGGSYAFARLSVLDPTSSSMQPANSHDIESAPIILFNGEIYNYKALAASEALASEKYSSDTQVLEKLLSSNAVLDVVPSLNGMFSICKIEKCFSQVTFARDIFGQKPLYFWQRNDRWAVSSDLFSLVALTDAKISERFLRQYVLASEELGTRGFYDIGQTPFQGIHAAEPGVCYEIANGAISESRISQERIWRENFFPAATSQSVSAEEFSATFDSVIDNYLTTDVKNAVAFSGGVDSSLITMSALSTGREVQGYMKIASGIDQVAQSALESFAHVQRLNVEVVGVEEDNYLSDLIELTALFCEPPRWGTGPSVVPLYERIKRDGFKVCLGGDGADELFFGYQNAALLADSIIAPSSFPLHSAIAEHSFSSRLINGKLALGERQQRLVRFFQDNIGESPEGAAYALKALRFLDMNSFFPTIPGGHSDLCSMSQSVELRSPFLDFEMVKLAHRDSLSIASLLSTGLSKSVLRTAAQQKATELNVATMDYLSQGKEGTRNFALRSVREVNLNKLPQDFISDVLDLNPSELASVSIKMKYKIVASFIFYRLFSDGLVPEKVKQEVAGLREAA